jgi:hypothetical protein
VHLPASCVIDRPRGLRPEPPAGKTGPRPEETGASH